MADEKKIETYLIKQVEKRGGMCVKFVPQHFAGFPDRLIYMPNGVHLLGELKAPHIKGVDKLQKIVHAKLRKLGFWVEVLPTKESVDALMDTLDHMIFIDD